MARLCFLTERMLRGWGVDHVIHRVAEGLVALGHEVDVVCLYADRSYGQAAYRVRILDVPPAPLETLEARVAARAGLLRQRPYDLFIASMFPFYGVAAALRLPFVYFEMGVVPGDGEPPERRALLARLRVEAQRHQLRARRVAAISRFLIAEQVNPARHRDTDVVYLGAESYGPAPAAADVAAVRATLGFAPGDDVVGYVGRVERDTYKGVDDLVEIVSALRRRRPGVWLLLLGNAHEDARRHFERYPFVRIVSGVAEHEMAAYFSAMDVAASASRWEGFNLPLGEAQYYARPVVAYRVGAHPEVVAPSGALVDTAAEFTAALAALLADPAARRRRGDEAQVWAQRFRWTETVAAMAASLRAAGAPLPVPLDRPARLPEKPTA